MPCTRASYWSRYTGVGLSFQKTAVLFSTMLRVLPDKKYYLKLDVDAILRPTNLLRFLAYLHHITGGQRSSPVYFAQTSAAPSGLTTARKSPAGRLPSTEDSTILARMSGA